MTAYYSEFDPYAAQWLRNLIKAGLIADGHVDDRSIVDVRPSDIAGYEQCHFFAGIGGWSLSARLAGWPDDRALWTGSCPCQPFSLAGKGAGAEDARHLWPEFYRLIAAARPPVVMGEQVAAAVGKSWLDGVYSDLESIGYACGAAVVPACAVDAPHRRDRLWFVADANGAAWGRAARDADRGSGAEEVQERQAKFGGRGSVLDVDNPVVSGLEGQSGHGDDGNQSGRFYQVQVGSVAAAGRAVSDADSKRQQGGEEQHKRPVGPSQQAPRWHNSMRSEFWGGSEWAVGADGKARRVEPAIRLLAHGVPGRVGKLRALGNAIVPQVAAEIIGAYLDCSPGSVAP